MNKIFYVVPEDEGQTRFQMNINDLKDMLQETTIFPETVVYEFLYSNCKDLDDESIKKIYRRIV